MKKSRLLSIILALSMVFSLIPSLVITANAAIGGVVTTTADSGAGSLRAAIEAAAHGDTITFSIPSTDKGYSSASGKWTIKLAGEIAFGKSLTINGGGAIIIDADQKGRALNFGVNGLLTIDGLEFKNGLVSDASQSFANGGAIYTNGSLTATNCSFYNNTANGNFSIGGAIGMGANDTNREIFLSDCVFENNSATRGGAVAVEVNYVSLTVENCTFRKNTATNGHGSTMNGGAICFREGLGNTNRAVIRNSVFESNAADYYGGAIYSDTNDPIVLENCQFRKNTVSSNGSRGGAVFASGPVSAFNCAFIENSSAFDGSGIFVYGSHNLIAVNCSFIGNIVQAPQSGSGAAQANFSAFFHCTFAKNTGGIRNDTILKAYNTISDDDSIKYAAGPFLTNVNFYNNRETFGYIMPGDHISTIKQAIPLTKKDITDAQITDDALIDKILSALITDQTGKDRGTFRCTYGAVEGTTNTWVVDSVADTAGSNTSGQRTLRWAITQANYMDQSDYRTIVFDETYFYGGTDRTITLGSYFPTITKQIIIYGRTKADGTPAVTIRRNGSDLSVLTSEYDGDLMLYGLKISGGDAIENGGGVNANKGSVIAESCVFTGNTASVFGGGVYAKKDLTLTNCLVEKNNSIQGGGAYSGQNAIITDCDITGNTSKTGGGGVMASGKITAYNSKFNNNTTSANGGGGINTNSSADITDCIFTGNTAYIGGGVMTSGNIIVYNSKFNNNTASTDGGGVMTSGKITAYNSSFINNTASTVSSNGGGVYTRSTADVTDCIFTGNMALRGSGIYADGNVSAINSSIVANSTISNYSGAIDGSYLYLYHTTVAKNTGIGVYSEVAAYSPFNCILTGNSGIQAAHGDGTAAARIISSTVGTNLVEGVGGVTHAAVFGKNTPNAQGILYPLGGGLAHGKASVLKPGSISYSGTQTPQNIVNALIKDITSSPRGTANISFGAVEATVDSFTVSYTANSLAKAPNSYAYGEALDLTDGKLTVDYASGGSDTLAMTDPMVKNSGFSDQAGTHTVTFTYLSNSCTLDFTVALAPTTITDPPIASNIYKGNNLSVSLLTGGSASVPGAFEWQTGGTIPTASGVYKAIFVPTDPNYESPEVAVAVTVIDKTALDSLITSARLIIGAATVGDGNGQYRQTDYSTFETAITAAANVSGIIPKDNTQAAVDNAKDALQAAVDIFNAAVRAVDTGNLLALINTASQKKTSSTYGGQNGDYAAAQEGLLGSAITAAQAAADKTDRTETEVAQAISELQTAINNFNATLVVVNYTALNDLISSCTNIHNSATEGMLDGQYEPDSKSAFKTAIDAADGVAKNARATQTEVNQAVIALTAARDAFASKKVGVNYDVLVSLIDEAWDKLNSSSYGNKHGDYPNSAGDALEEEIVKAYAISLSIATQAQVNAAVSALQAAIYAFNASVIVVNYTALNDLLSTANNAIALASVGSGNGQTPTAAFTALQSAITDAQTVASDDNSQTDVNTAYTALNTALSTFNAAKIAVSNASLLALIQTATQKYTTSNYGTGNGDYAPEQEALLGTAITAAQSIANKSTRTSAEVNAELAALQAAMDAFDLTRVTVNYSSLNISIAECNAIIDIAVVGLGDGQYEPSSMTDFEAAISTADGIAQNTRATQAEVDRAIVDLTAARDVFASKKITVSRNALLTLLAEALNKYKNSNYGDKHGEYPLLAGDTLQVVHTAASNVNTSPNSSQAEVDAAESTLQAAIDAFDASVIVVDYTALNDLLTTAKTARGLAEEGDGDGQTPAAAFMALEAAIDTAQIIADYDNSQTDVDGAYTALNTALSAFIAAKITVDFTALETAITDAKAIQPGSYTTASWDALQTAITDGEAVRTATAPPATQSEVDAAVQAITTAVTQLANHTIIIISDTESYTITFEYHEGEELIKSERASYEQDRALTAADLKIPAGYELAQANFTFTVTKDETVKIQLVKIEETPEPTPELTEKPYISGYPDGTFKPDGEITRAEIMQMIYNMIGGNKAADLSVLDRYSEMAEPHWADTPLAWAIENGYIKGYDDGTIMPDAPITRAELAAVLHRIAQAEGLFGETGTASVQLSDIDGHWAHDDIMALAANGIVQGYGDGAFRPDDDVTRAETVVMLSRLFGRTDEFNADKTFTDVPETHWAYAYIMNAANGC